MSVATQLTDLLELDHIASREGPHEWLRTSQQIGLTGIHAAGREHNPMSTSEWMIKMVICRCGYLQYHLGEYYGEVESRSE